VGHPVGLSETFDTEAASSGWPAFAGHDNWNLFQTDAANFKY
jgi:hypothetical protein